MKVFLLIDNISVIPTLNKNDAMETYKLGPVEGLCGLLLRN